MPKTDVYNLSGEKTSSLELNDKIFGLPENADLIHQTVTVFLGNQRSAHAHTKTRAEVRGGGRKPFKQKGTGRARAGSTRSPLWIGGGVTFGPRQANYKRTMPQKMRNLALLTALSYHAKNKLLIMVDELKDFSKIGTKHALDALAKFPLSNKTVLIIINDKLPNLQLSLRNVKYIKVINVNTLNTYDILNYETILLDKKTLKTIESMHIRKNNKKSVKIAEKSAPKIANEKE